MRKVNNLALVAAIWLPLALVSGAAAQSTFADQLEMLEWSDPERAAQIIDAAPPLSADGDAAEIDMLEDLILAAHTDAKEKIDQMAEAEMKNATGGMSLPAGLKLPF